MAHPSKNKGNRFERLIVNLTKDLGIKAKRAYASDGRALGCHEEVDVLINDTIKVQCKARKRIANWMIPSKHVDIQVIKEDRGIPYAVLPYDDYLKLIQDET
jgi:Holliday junction resolvase